MYKCCVCGQFCRPADSSTPFGEYDSLDPFAENFYCANCVEREKVYHIKTGWLPANWRKAKWESEVAKVLGYILIHLEGASWSVWHKESEPIPLGYQPSPQRETLKT